MTPEQKAAYVMSESACAMARIAGMQAENAHRLSVGQSIAYGEDAFEKVMVDFQITHNAVLTIFHGS